MKYYIIAGEASGDLHAANLMKALKQQDPSAVFRCWGGDKMQAQGGEIVKHYKDLAFMGFLEVVMHLRTILNNISFCKQDILQWQPDVVILVDYPGFNLRIARFLKQQGIKTFFYISPQVWAWKESRVETIRQTVDKMFVILPFEKAFYQKHHYEVDFVGHPLLDELEGRQEDTDFKTRNGLDVRPIIALLPGSRKQEIKKMLPELIKVVPLFPEYQFVIAGLKNIGEDFYRSYLRPRSQDSPASAPACKIVMDQTYSLLENAQAALVTSGTATMETALFNVPQVVCYKGSWLSYQIGRRLVKIKYIAMVNLVMDKPVVKELIQDELNVVNLQHELQQIMAGSRREQILGDYLVLKEKLGGPGASERAAKLMVEYLRK